MTAGRENRQNQTQRRDSKPPRRRSASSTAVFRIIDPHPRGGDKLPLAPAEKERFKERTAAERVNSLLKERYGGRWVRVRGAAKVMCHLMFGLVALTATALFARLC